MRWSSILISGLSLSLTACPKTEPVADRGPASAPASAPSSAPADPKSMRIDPIKTASLSASRLRTHVATLADDAFEGRGAATAGIERAATYLEKALAEAGLAPAFDESFRQAFELRVGADIGPKNTLKTAGKPLRAGRNFMPFPFSSTGTASGDLVFVGYAISAKEHKYSDFAHTDVRGKIVVALEGEPGERDDASPFDGKRASRYSLLSHKVLNARERGARAILIVRDTLRFQSRHMSDSDAGLLAAQITPRVAQRLLGFDVRPLRAEIDRTYRSASRKGKSAPVSVELSVTRKQATNHNVAGVIGQGAEAVVLGAHYDHLGYGGASSLAPSDAPVVHNGADDNASGTAVVLEAARALAPLSAQLKKRIYFVLFAGEENGLLGSRAFVSDGPEKPQNIAAMINLDMVGHLRDGKLSVMGAEGAPELTAPTETLLRAHGLDAAFAEGAWGPSDHTSFYAAKVPVLFIFTGAHEHYHKPSDDPDTLDYPGAAKVGALAADIAFAIARSEDRPRYVEVSAPTSRGGRGYGPSFGSIPDFGEQKDGVLLSGVRKDSPADKAGVARGDVIVEFAGVTVKNLRDFTEALRSCAPGDEVTVKVRRGAKTLELKAVLERRAE